MNKQNRNKLIETGNKLMVARWEEARELCGKGGGIKKYKLVVTGESRGCNAQHREYSNNIAITVDGVKSVLDRRHYFVSYRNV